MENNWRRKIFVHKGEEERKRKRRKIFGRQKYLFHRGDDYRVGKVGKSLSTEEKNKGEGKGGNYLEKEKPTDRLGE